MIDINLDGLMDYFSSEAIYVNEVDGFEYINKKTYRYDRVGGFFSKKAMKSCEVHHYGRFFITTDGNDFYINDQCNINELIK